MNPPGWYYDPIAVHFYLEGHYREMLASAEHSAAGDATDIAFLAIAQGALGNVAAAKKALAMMAEQGPAVQPRSGRRLAALPPARKHRRCAHGRPTRGRLE